MVNWFNNKLLFKLKAFFKNLFYEVLHAKKLKQKIIYFLEFNRWIPRLVNKLNFLLTKASSELLVSSGWVLTRWVLVPRDDAGVKSYWYSQHAHSRVRVTFNIKETEFLPAVMPGVPLSNFANFVGLFILFSFIFGAIISLLGRAYISLSSRYSGADTIFNTETITPHAKTWYFTALYIARIFSTDFLFVVTFFLFPLTMLDSLNYDTLAFFKRGTTWFTQLTHSQLWVFFYWATNYRLLISQFMNVVLYAREQRILMLDPNNKDIFTEDESEGPFIDPLDEFVKKKQVYEEDIVSLHEAGIRWFIQMLTFSVFFWIPTIYGAYTVLFIYILGADVNLNSGLYPIRERQKKAGKARSYKWVGKVLGFVPRKERIKHHLKYAAIRREKRLRWKVNRSYRMEKWVGKPALDLARLKRVTVMPRKTPEEMEWLEAEWFRYYKSLDSKQRIRGRYLLKRKKFLLKLEQKENEKSASRWRQYEDLVNGGKILTHKQYLKKINKELQDRWKLEEPYFGGLRNLLPSDLEKSSVQAMFTRRIPITKKYATKLNTFIVRRKADFEDFYFIYWEYSTAIGNKFFPNFRKKIRYFIKRHSSNIWLGGRIKFKKYLYKLQRYLNTRPLKKKIDKFYFVNVQYPIKKTIINFKRLFFIAKFTLKARFKKHSKAITKYVKKNSNKQHVIIGKRVFTNIKLNVISFCNVFINIYKDINNFFQKWWVARLFRWIIKTVKSYFSKKAWNKKTWKNNYIKELNAQKMYMEDRFRAQLQFDRFMNKLGRIKNWLPVNSLRRFYVWCFSPYDELYDGYIITEREVQEGVAVRDQRRFLRTRERWPMKKKKLGYRRKRHKYQKGVYFLRRIRMFEALQRRYVRAKQEEFEQHQKKRMSERIKRWRSDNAHLNDTKNQKKRSNDNDTTGWWF